MGTWKISVGNLVSRAAASPVAVSPATADTLYPLANLGDGYPDVQAGFQWRSDGTYDADLDLNLLASSSDRVDAPTGWGDLLNLLAGTPGLPANPPDWGTYAGRTALRLFRPTCQLVDVMPGEALKWSGGIYRPSGASGATAIEVRVVDIATGKQYDAGAVAWDHDGKIDEQATADAWKDTTVTINPDASQTERRTYRIVVSPVAASYGATSYVYVSASGGSGSPALFAELDVVALLGHNIPSGATVQLQPQPSGTAISLTVAQPSCYATITPAAHVQTWRLSIDIPSALRPTAPRPIIGELWLGQTVDLNRSPTLPIVVGEGDAGQVRIEGARGRQEILGTDGLPAANLQLEFTVPDAGYVQMRDGVLRLTGFGQEPVLLIPTEDFEGAGRVFHGRVGKEVSYSRFTAADSDDHWRSFRLAFDESPMAAP